MKERPILFSVPMVRAILDGKKTQTRRVIKQQPSGGKIFPPNDFDRPDHWYFRDAYYACEENDIGNYVKCPYGKPGDRLWVREAWALGADRQGEGKFFYQSTDEANVVKTEMSSGVVCLGGRNKDKIGHLKRWRPAIHMPRHLCRIILEIADIRVEKLQSITEEDAVTEGAREWAQNPDVNGLEDKPRAYDNRQNDWCRHSRIADPNTPVATSRGAFAALWESINGDKPGASWKDNPYVWVISFRRIQNEQGGKANV